MKKLLWSSAADFFMCRVFGVLIFSVSVLLLLILNTGYETASAAKLHRDSLFPGAEDPVTCLRCANIDKFNRLL